MTPPKQWKEWWIDKDEENQFGWCNAFVSESTASKMFDKTKFDHVIEYAAYEELKKEITRYVWETGQQIEIEQGLRKERDAALSRVTELEKALEKFVNIDDSSKLPLVERQGQSKLDRYEWAVICARQALSKELGK